MEDAQIVTLFLERNESAISETAAKYGQRLRSLSFGIVQNRETAEECENDTYLEAWKRIPPHEPRKYLYAFLARITRHLALNRIREAKSQKRHAFLTDLSAELEQCLPSGEDPQLDQLALKEALNGFLATLSVEKRNIFLRRYWFLDSIERISEGFGISQSKVKTTLFRCRKGLKSYLEQEGYEL